MKTKVRKPIKRWWIWASAGMIVAALIVLCCVRWQAWFGNPIEPAYVANDSICRMQLTFGRLGVQSRAVSWQCGDTQQPASLFLIEENNADTQIVAAASRLFDTPGGRAVYYFADMGVLTAGKYTYMVQVGQQQSAWHRFTVGATDAAAITFVYVGDVQDAAGACLRSTLTEVERRFAPDFWLFGGDVIERPHDCYWQAYYDMVTDFGKSTPVVAVPGNHEYIKGLDKRLDERFVWTFPYFLDTNGRFSGVATYTFAVGGAKFYLLDSNNDIWTLPHERVWLQRQVAVDTANWQIAVLHHPVYSLRGCMTNFWVRRAFAPVFDEQFDMVFAGHEHAYARRTTAGTTPVYIVSQCSPKDYRINLDAGYERYGIGCRFYQIVRIAGDTLCMSAYKIDHELYDRLTLIKTANGVVVHDDYACRPEYLYVDSTRYRKKRDKRAAYQQRIEQRRQSTEAGRCY